MNNKFLVIAAATTTALSTALVWTPAHAQITGSNVPVNVNITVPEVLFLKTVKDIVVNIPASDVIGTQFTGSLTGGFAFDNSTGTAGTGQAGVNTLTPFAGGATSTVNQSISNVYVVWSNSARGKGINITFNKDATVDATKLTLVGGSDTISYSIVSGNKTGLIPQGLVTPIDAGGGGVTLALDLTNAKTAGSYKGILTVTADAP